ncbi:MAG: ATPase [Clostridia bacterium]|nr:ATPase [Clostridia bacterium]
MAIAKMKFVRVYGPVARIDDFISSCCLTGEIHPENALDYMSASLGFSGLSGESAYGAKIQRIEELADIADASLEEDFELSDFNPEDFDEGMIDEMIDKMQEFHRLHTELTEEIESCEKEKEQYSHFVDLDTSIKELLDCKFVRVRFGSMPVECSDKLAAYQEKEHFVFVTCERTATDVWGVYVAPRNNVDKIDRIFASLYFERVKLKKEAGTPSEVLNMIGNEEKLLLKSQEKLETEIAEYWNSRAEVCNALYAYLKQCSEAFDLRRYAATDRLGKTFTFVGWIPAKSANDFTKRVAALDDISCEISEPSEDKHGEPPVKLRNKRLFRPFEMFVSMYGLPSYDGVDITPFVAITYSIIFGIMFADFGQGLLLMIGAFILSKTKGMALAKILVPCGFCSTVFGFLFGSVFGFEHLLDPIYQKVFGLPGKPIEVMESINGVLLMAISIGIGLVAVAMLMNIVIRLKSKEIGEALFSENGLAGLLLYGALFVLIYKFMSGTQLVPTIACVIVIAVTVPILFAKEILIGFVQHKRKDEFMPESAADFVMQNIFELIEYILSYFSNTVSFLRIGAFVLVHAGMMMVFFSLAGNPKSPADVSVGGWFAIVLGNVLVMALEGLLTGIQALRLEYYEMFSRFYDGGGRPFAGVGKPEGHRIAEKIKKAAKRRA